MIDASADFASGQGELAQYIPDPKPSNTSNGGKVCYNMGAVDSTGRLGSSYFLWIVTEDEANGSNQVVCGREIGSPIASKGVKWGYAAVGKGNHINCPHGWVSCDL